MQQISMYKKKNQSIKNSLVNIFFIISVYLIIQYYHLLIKYQMKHNI